MVDDSATMRKVFELTFAGEEVTVVTHDGGDGAVAKIREVRPQAAIVDVALGNGTTGYDLVRSIRSEGNLGPIPIYLLYSEHSPLDEPAARSCGAVGAIVKPFESQVLIDKVRQALSQVKAPAAATTGNMTAPFGNPQPVPTIVAAMPPAPANKGSETAPFTAPRPGGIVAGGRPATGANPAARSPVAAPASPAASLGGTPSAVRPPPPLPGGGRAPVPGTPSIATPAKPAEKPSPVSIVEDEVSFEATTGARTVDAPTPTPAAAAKPAGTVHDKPTAPVMPAAVDGAVQAAAKAIEGQAAALGLSPAQVEAITALTRDVVERVVWEVVPQLAETIIREELKRLTAD
ncbi:MAG: response regulator [Polyangiales bacterium]